jgi:hypothetical protein
MTTQNPTPTYYAPPQQPAAQPKKSHKLRNSFLVGVGVIVAIVIATQAGGGSKHNSGSANPSSKPSASEITNH